MLVDLLNGEYQVALYKFAWFILVAGIFWMLGFFKKELWD